VILLLRTRPSGEVNQLAISVMKESGIDISNQKSKIITEDKLLDYKYILTK
jgi:protein-tyrosine-phosphatase